MNRTRPTLAAVAARSVLAGGLTCALVLGGMGSAAAEGSRSDGFVQGLAKAVDKALTLVADVQRVPESAKRVSAPVVEEPINATTEVVDVAPSGCCPMPELTAPARTGVSHRHRDRMDRHTAMRGDRPRERHRRRPVGADCQQLMDPLGVPQRPFLEAGASYTFDVHNGRTISDTYGLYVTADPNGYGSVMETMFAYVDC